MSEMGEMVWRRASFSGSGNNCVEVATGASHILVRDSKNPDGPRLRLSRAAFTACLDTIVSRDA
jgi:hypothetical protein